MPFSLIYLWAVIRSAFIVGSIHLRFLAEVATMSDAERDALQAAITFWEAFDLDGRRQKMDMTCLELKEGKEVNDQLESAHKCIT